MFDVQISYWKKPAAITFVNRLPRSPNLSLKYGKLSGHVIEVLADAMVQHRIPEHIRSDNGAEFVAKDLRKWLQNTGVKTLYIEPGSPWENGYCESFDSKLRDEFLNGEIFYSLKEVQVLGERWRIHYNTARPTSVMVVHDTVAADILAFSR